jgi:hypothetical protein
MNVAFGDFTSSRWQSFDFENLDWLKTLRIIWIGWLVKYSFTGWGCDSGWPESNLLGHKKLILNFYEFCKVNIAYGVKRGKIMRIMHRMLYFLRHSLCHDVTM